MYNEDIISIQSETRILESYFALSEMIEDSVVMESFSDIKQKANRLSLKIKEFFKRVLITIKNFIMKYLGKNGKLLNVKAMRLILARSEAWNLKSRRFLEDARRHRTMEEIEEFGEVIGSDGEKLINDVEIAVLNFPKLADFQYFDGKKFQSLQNTANVFEGISDSILSGLDDDFESDAFSIAMSLTEIFSTMTTTLLTAITKAIYKSKEENSTITFDPIEVEIMERD